MPFIKTIIMLLLDAHILHSLQNQKNIVFHGTAVFKKLDSLEKQYCGMTAFPVYLHSTSFWARATWLAVICKH